MKKLLTAAMLAGAVLGGGCASFIKGSTQSVGISSSPSRAKVSVDSCFIGTTPLVTELERTKNHFVIISKSGYESGSAALTPRFSPLVVIVGNLVSWGPLGMVIDVLSGSGHDLTPPAINVTLAKRSDSSHPRLDSDQVEVIEDQTPILLAPHPDAKPIMQAMKNDIFSVNTVTPEWVQVAPSHNQKKFWLYFSSSNARHRWLHGTSGAGIRAGKGAAHPVITSVTPDDVVHPAGKRGGWIQVRLRSDSRWIHKKQVRGPGLTQ